MFADVKLKLTLLMRRGWKFRLGNGLDATLYRLDNRKVKAIAAACEHTILMKTTCCAIRPDDRKRYYVVEVNVFDEKVYLVHFSETSPFFICADLRLAENYALRQVFLVIHRNQADYFLSHMAQVVLESIRTKTPLPICALIN